MDENKKLSSEEQREKMKQEYLQELKLRKQILDQMKQANKMHKISENLEQVLKLAQISDDIDEFIQKLNSSSELSGAKLDLSLHPNDKNTSSTAERLLNQIKMEMGLLEQKIQQEPIVHEASEMSKTLLEEEKSSENISADKKFSTKTIENEEH